MEVITKIYSLAINYINFGLYSIDYIPITNKWVCHNLIKILVETMRHYVAFLYCKSLLLISRYTQKHIHKTQLLMSVTNTSQGLTVIISSCTAYCNYMLATIWHKHCCVSAGVPPQQTPSPSLSVLFSLVCWPCENTDQHVRTPTCHLDQPYVWGVQSRSSTSPLPIPSPTDTSHARSPPLRRQRRGRALP